MLSGSSGYTFLNGIKLVLWCYLWTYCIQIDFTNWGNNSEYVHFEQCLCIFGLSMLFLGTFRPKLDLWPLVFDHWNSKVLQSYFFDFREGTKNIGWQFERHSKLTHNENSKGKIQGWPSSRTVSSATSCLVFLTCKTKVLVSVSYFNLNLLLGC